MAEEASFEHLEARSLPDLVQEQVVEAMRAGRLKPGQRIVEVTLARQLGVSRGPLREALKSLEAVSLVETRRGKGSFVARVTIEQMLEMSAVRAAIEGMAARAIAATRDPSVLATLGALNAEIVSAARADVGQWRQLNWSFHEAVCAASGNAFILRSWQSISLFVRMFMNENVAFENDPATVLDNQARLLGALTLLGPDAAETVFRGLILKSAYDLAGQAAPPALAGLIRSAQHLRTSEIRNSDNDGTQP